MLYLQLFYTFFKIGLFGFGGGYAMLSMIQGEVVTRYGWLTSQEFTDIVAISQMTPGPIGINSATYVGFTATGSVWGSIIATLAVVLPSFILMLAISKFFLKYQKHPVVEAVFSGLRPAVVGLLASAALVLMNAENFSSPKEDMYSAGSRDRGSRRPCSRRRAGSPGAGPAAGRPNARWRGAGCRWCGC